jgi:hypothetical protein
METKRKNGSITLKDMKPVKYESLLVENNIGSVKQRLKTTLENINFQGGKIYVDDIEKIEHCIKALENIKINDNNFMKVYNDLLEENKYYRENYW